MTGSTGPVGLGPPVVRRDPEHRLEIRLFGSPKRLLSMARGWLRGKGHKWQVMGRAMVCDRCLASVLVDPPSKALLQTLPDGSRRLRQARYPGAADIRLVRSRYPGCRTLQDALVEAVADR
jgi:hypothetical protein